MTSKQKQKLTVCIVFLLVVLVFILIDSPSDVVDQNSQLHEALSEAEIIELEGEKRCDKGFDLPGEIDASFTLSKEELKEITLSKEELKEITLSKEDLFLSKEDLFLSKESLAQSRK
jgi:hypothetical protein